MDIQLPISILPQPDNTTCGPTCLHAVYNYFGDDITLDAVIADTQMLTAGGTLAVFLACAALRRGYKATIYTYNLQIFDPSWFVNPDINISERLQRQADVKKGDSKLQHATTGYLDFLQLGGKLRFTDLTTRLLRSIMRRNLPILTGLSSTYLYSTKREYGPDDHDDDIRGFPAGHFVVLCGYHKQGRTVLVADPLLHNPVASGQLYSVNIDRLICAILLGVLTYDDNLLIIHPRR
ncbi:MAG: hypothetical protein HY356_06085 [Gammaproteobacteria bacterium]|nr:hypothetical protein [Gammaproteobacteria bacterium]